MKKFIWTAGTFVCAAAMYVGYCAVQDTQTLTELISVGGESLTRGESDRECHWEQIKCDGHRAEACIRGGDGNPCTCGETTRDC